MKIEDVKIPSNRKFGIIFTALFLAGTGYFFYAGNVTIASLLGALGAIFAVITLINADLLLPINKAWMQFGVILGMVVSPIVMGIIFFGLITPYGIIMRISGRDELRLKQQKSKTYWTSRPNADRQTDWTRQY
jgi:hypothetical protein